MVHTINLTGYSAIPVDCRALILGTAKSYGIEQLQIITDAAWVGLTITATFVTATSAVKMLVDPDGTVQVPPEATANPTNAILGRIVFAGVADGVQRISCDLPYRVMAHAPIDGVASKSTPNEWQQYVAEMQKIINKAVPSDGEVGQVLTKTANGSEWADPTGSGTGLDGATFTPSVSPEGIISWMNDKGKPNPEPVNIKGRNGEDGKGVASITGNDDGSWTIHYTDQTTENISNNAYKALQDAINKAEKDGDWEIIETSVSDGTPGAFKRTKEPNGTPYKFKKLRISLSIEKSNKQEWVSGYISANGGDAGTNNIAYVVAEFQQGDDKHIRFDVSPCAGNWESVSRYNGGAQMFYDSRWSGDFFEQNTVKEYPCLSGFEISNPQAGTKIVVKAVRA